MRQRPRVTNKISFNFSCVLYKDPNEFGTDYGDTKSEYAVDCGRIADRNKYKECSGQTVIHNTKKTKHTGNTKNPQDTGSGGDTSENTDSNGDLNSSVATNFNGDTDSSADMDDAEDKETDVTGDTKDAGIVDNDTKSPGNTNTGNSGSIENDGDSDYMEEEPPKSGYAEK